jgi:hypothetical protein
LNFPPSDEIDATRRDRNCQPCLEATDAILKGSCHSLSPSRANRIASANRQAIHAKKPFTVSNHVKCTTTKSSYTESFPRVHLRSE